MPIDLDQPPAATRRPVRRIIAAAAALLATAAIAAGSATAVATTSGQDVAVTVYATPTTGAAAQITRADGSTVEPPWGRPVHLTTRPRYVSVITWADERGGSCLIVIDGTVAADDLVVAAGQPASCVWPE